MHGDLRAVVASLAVLILGFPAITVEAAKGKENPKEANTAGEGPAVLWREAADIATRNLYYGPGGKEHEPRGTFHFEKEVMDGTSPKFDVVDQNGVRWRVKLGQEARPETAASRLVWATGYFAPENYFVPSLPVENMPRLHRGGKVVEKDGTVHNARLKRHEKGMEKIGAWSWSDDPFRDTREWYALRVLMAVMNNWDLKDQNNAIYQVRGNHPEQRYVVNDLGASFGTTGLNKNSTSKGNLKEYRQSKWVRGSSGGFVNFNVPSAPSFDYSFNLPELMKRVSLLWLGRHIPPEHARWMGQLLGKLSPAQIRDAFRAAGYSTEEVEGFSQVVEQRIAELQKM